MKRPLKTKGITLLEIVISLAILSIVVISVGNLGFSLVKIDKYSDEKLKANVAAQHIVEYIKEPSILLENIEEDLISSPLGLTELEDEDMKKLLIDEAIGETVEDFLFYKKDDMKDCYVRVKVSEGHYNPDKVSPESNKITSDWDSTSFHYKLKIAKDDNGFLKLYDITSGPNIIKSSLEKDSNSIVLRVINENNKISYSLNQDGQDIVVVDASKDIGADEPKINIQIEECKPEIILNVENNDNKELKLFITELLQSSSLNYIANYKIFTKGDVTIYTKTDKENKTLVDLDNINKLQVKIYKYEKNNVTLLQNIEDYKYKSK